MNVRVRFAKYGAVKFIGHLDVLRYFQKAVRRAGLKIAYSQGFHPHQIMSFASPLGVGITSEGEYMDMELTAPYTPKKIVEALNEAMADGFLVTSCRILPEPENGRKRETAMSLVTAADYLVAVKDNSESGLFTPSDELKTRWNAFCAQESIPVVKKVKKSGTETSIDLKPFLYGAETFAVPSVDSALATCLTEVTPREQSTDYYALSDAPDFAADFDSFCEEENLFCVKMRVSAGSADNIKPELVMEAFARYLGCEDTDAYRVIIHRLDMYTGTAPEFCRL